MISEEVGGGQGQRVETIAKGVGGGNYCRSKHCQRGGGVAMIAEGKGVGGGNDCRRQRGGGWPGVEGGNYC